MRDAEKRRTDDDVLGGTVSREALIGAKPATMIDDLNHHRKEMHSLRKYPLEPIEDLIMPFFGYDPDDFAVDVSSSPIRHLVLAWIIVLPYYIIFRFHLDIQLGFIYL